jgi:hypothetical protein
MVEPATGRRRRRQVLTDKMVADLPRRVTPYFHPDPELPKHGVRIRPTGPGSYTVIIRDAYGKQRWVKIGSTAELRIAEAREVARGVIQRIGRGLEPFEPPPVKPDTVADVFATYCKRHTEARGLRSAREKRRIIERYVLPVWRDRPFTGIGRSDIARLCDSVEDEHGAWVADSVLIQLSAIARWFASRHDTYLPPFIAGMKRVPGEAHKRSDRRSATALCTPAPLPTSGRARCRCDATGPYTSNGLMSALGHKRIIQQCEPIILSSIAGTDGRTWPICFRVKRARDGSNRGRRAVHSLRLHGSRTNSHRLAHSVDVRFGSKADMTLLNFDVRFTPESGHPSTQSKCPLWANRRHSLRGDAACDQSCFASGRTNWNSAPLLPSDDAVS